MIVVALLLGPATARAAPHLTAGPTTLTFPANGVALGPYATATPAVVVTAAGVTATAPYDHVDAAADRVTATATVATPDGAHFAFTDTWTTTPDGGFRLARRVTTPDRRDGGFDTRLALTVPEAKSVRDAELFAPGVWYRHNDHVVPHAIGADPDLGTYLIKETRLALPLITARPNGTGPALTILHADAHPATGLRDADRAAQTDGSIQYGSLGYDANQITFCYPGTEGTVSYGAPGPRGRYHPVRPGVPHAYDLVLRLGPPGDFPTIMTDAWRHALATYAPVVHNAPSTALYHDGLAVFDRYYRDNFPKGGRGLPFMIWLGLHPPRGRDVHRGNPPSGRGPSDYHLQSGFVGLQTEADYLMLRRATLAHDAAGVARWSAAVDFWVDNSMTDAGVPRTDYFAEPARWADDPSFLRTLCDGAEGLADADRLRPTPRWRAYLVRAGDWLLRAQRPDGSWARSYNLDGTEANPGAFNTSNPIRFLCQLTALTGDMKYHDAAVRAGEWCLAHVDAESAYVGGTSDNDNTIDKEGGVMAFYGFDALYDATGDRRWLAAAARAADYVETWVYGWSFPLRPNRGLLGSVHSPWPACGLVGQSLVATGHSYADMYMVGCSTAYYRLSLQTGDAHYRDVARLLADGANRPADLTGALNYPDRGEIEEGVNAADFAADGVGTCLTWCTVSQVRPVAQLQDLFGADTVDDVERRLTPAQRQARNRPWYARR